MKSTEEWKTSLFFLYVEPHSFNGAAWLYWLRLFIINNINWDKYCYKREAKKTHIIVDYEWKGKLLNSFSYKTSIISHWFTRFRFTIQLCSLGPTNCYWLFTKGKQIIYTKTIQVCLRKIKLVPKKLWPSQNMSFSEIVNGWTVLVTGWFILKISGCSTSSKYFVRTFFCWEIWTL